MSKITGTHHIAVRAADFDKSISFYTETLGLTLKTTWVMNGKRVAMVEITPGTYMEVFERGPESFSGSPSILHFCFRTDDVDGMVERARAAGYGIRVEPKDLPLETSIGPVGLRLAFITGPDGEDIEFLTSAEV